MQRFGLLTVCAAVLLAACADQAPQAEAASAVAASHAGDARLNRQMDEELAELKAGLPANDEPIRMVDVEREGAIVRYKYDIIADADGNHIEQQDFDQVSSKDTMQALCEPPIKEYLDADYTFEFVYAFPDGDSRTVSFTRADCSS